MSSCPINQRWQTARALRFDWDPQRPQTASGGKTPAQVLVRWGLQNDLVVLPKSVRRARIAENAAAMDFALDAAAMQALDALDEGLVTAWDPETIP